jgi:hypothetical protein
VTSNVDPQNNVHSYNLQQLLSFFRIYVEEEVRNSLAKAGFKLNDSSVQKNKEKPNMEAPVSTVSDLFSGGRKVGKQLSFILCENHTRIGYLV